MPGRLALCGPTGSGKTFSALRIATGMLLDGGTIAVIDSERRSASKYADLFQFDVMELETHSPMAYVAAIKDAAKAGYPVLIIDSLSHAWMGKDGALEQVDKIAKRSQSGNSFVAWRDVTPMHNELIDTILNYPGHAIVTMRSKMEYVMEDNGKGKKTPVKIGMAPEQRQGMEYEFDVVGDMNFDNEIIISKTRCPKFKGLILREPGEDFGRSFLEWLNAGKDVVAYVKEESDACETLADLRNFKEQMRTAGGAYWTDETKAIITARVATLTPNFEGHEPVKDADPEQPDRDSLFGGPHE